MRESLLGPHYFFCFIEFFPPLRFLNLIPVFLGVFLFGTSARWPFRPNLLPIWPSMRTLEEFVSASSFLTFLDSPHGWGGGLESVMLHGPGFSLSLFMDSKELFSVFPLSISSPLSFSIMPRGALTAARAFLGIIVGPPFFFPLSRCHYRSFPFSWLFFSRVARVQPFFFEGSGFLFLFSFSA